MLFFFHSVIASFSSGVKFSLLEETCGVGLKMSFLCFLTGLDGSSVVDGSDNDLIGILSGEGLLFLGVFCFFDVGFEVFC